MSFARECGQLSALMARRRNPWSSSALIIVNLDLNLLLMTRFNGRFFLCLTTVLRNVLRIER